MSGSIIVRDPVTDEIDYEWVAVTEDNTTVAQSAIDYDLDDEFPWASYAIENSIYQERAGNISPLLTDVEAVMDDGTSVLLKIRYVSDAEMPVGLRLSETYTVKDAQGRTLSVDQINITAPIGPNIEDVFDFRQQSIVYDPESGRVDFISTLSLAGVRESIDYDVTTGQRDYVYIQQADGGTISEDYNAANGVLDYRRVTSADGGSLDQDYDSQGRLDYAVERLADGRMRVTDYDLANQHDWASYSILYAASGAIESVTVL